MLTRRKLAAICAAVTLTLVTGCGDDPGPADDATDTTVGDSPLSCDLPLGEGDGSDGAAALLSDTTLSSERRAERADVLSQLLDRATADGDVLVSVGSFGGSDAEVHFADCLDGVAFVPRGNNGTTRKANRPALLEAAAKEIAKLPTGFTATDPVAALREGVRRLPAGSKRRTLVVLTDGVPTAGCAALPESVDLGDPGLVERLTSACRDRGLLPDATGVRIIIGEVGRTDETLTADAVTFLLQLHRSLCDATGATCEVGPNPPLSLDTKEPPS